MLPPPKLQLGTPEIKEDSTITKLLSRYTKEAKSAAEELSTKVKKPEEQDPSCALENYGDGDNKKEQDTEGKTLCIRCEGWFHPNEFEPHWNCHSTEILEWLYLGGLRNATNLKELTVRTNIGHILNVAVECYNAFPGKFKYKNIDLEDHKHEKIIEKFQEAFEFIHSAKKDGSKILIHCVQGMSRSATIVIAFLMFDSKMTLKEAYGFVKSKRTIIEPNPGFMKQLIEYEFQIHGKNSITISEYVSK